jgi:hypothetical protein
VLLSFHPLLVGANPFQTTSIYALILYLERKWGVWFAQGGTGSIMKALAELFVEIGGEHSPKQQSRADPGSAGRTKAAKPVACG